MIILTHNGYIRKGAFSRDSGLNKKLKYEVAAEKTVQIQKLCPACGERERNYDPNGFYRSYCNTCHQKYNREAYHRNKNIIREPKNKTLCAKCRERPKEKPLDRHNTYCTECRREKHRKEYYLSKQRKQRNLTNYLTQ